METVICGSVMEAWSTVSVQYKQCVIHILSSDSELQSLRSKPTITQAVSSSGIGAILISAHI